MTEPVPPELPRATLHVVERWVLTRRATLGFAIAFVLFVAAGIGGFREQRHIAEAGEWSMHTMEVVDQSRVVVRMMTDAETGERGYLLTGDARYLTAYDEADKDLVRPYGSVDAGYLRQRARTTRARRAATPPRVQVGGAPCRGRAQTKRQRRSRARDARRGSGKRQDPTDSRSLQRIARPRTGGSARADRVRRPARRLASVGSSLSRRCSVPLLRSRRSSGLNPESQKRLSRSVKSRESRSCRARSKEKTARRSEPDVVTLYAPLRSKREAASRSKDGFLAVLSHELRSRFERDSRHRIDHAQDGHARAGEGQYVRHSDHRAGT